MEEKFKFLVDNRNFDLWKTLDDKYHIQVEESEEPGYLTNFGDDRVIILVDMQDLRPACFTHELLHVYIKYREVFIAKDLKETVETNEKLDRLFSDSLIVHLGNCLEHQKMLPLYLGRGYDNKDFVRDYEERILKKEEIQELGKSFIQDGMYSREAFDTYLGKFFSMKTSNNSSFNYDENYLGLGKIDTGLYQVVESFWKNWKDYDIGQPREDYLQMLKKFSEDLLKWKEDKVVI